MPRERVLRLGIDPSAAVRGGQRFDQAAESSIAAALGLNKAVLRTAIGVTAVGAALVGATAALGKFAQAGGRQLTVQAAFSRRVGDTEAALVKLRAATSGLVTDMELMTQANQSLTLGSARTVDEFAELAETAQTLGRALGLDVAFALNSLNIGIARQSRLVLDNVGLIVSAGVANRKYAAALGVTVDQLTDAEKQEAFRIEAITQARQKTEELGETTLNAGDAFTGFNTELSNTVDHFSRMVAQSDAVAAFFNDAARAVRGLRGDLEDLNAERVFFLETGGTAMSPGEAADARLITSGRRAGGATQYGARGSGVAHLAEMFEEAQKRMEELGATTEESFEDMVARVRDFESEMARLEFQLQVTGKQLPRIISGFEAISGFQPVGRRSMGPGDFGRTTTGSAVAFFGGVDRSDQAATEFQKWVGETAKNLKPLAEGAEDAASGFDGLANAFTAGASSRLNMEGFAANLGANLASQGVGMLVGALGDALFGPEYVNITEENTRALRDLTTSVNFVASGIDEGGVEGLFDSGIGWGALRLDELRRQGFAGSVDLERRRLDARDAGPGDEFAGLRDVLAQGLSGPLADQVAGLTPADIEAFLLDILKQIELGTLDAEDLGAVSLTQLLDLLAEMERLGDTIEGVTDEFDGLMTSIQALNSPQGLNLALLGYRASLTGGPVGGGGSGEPGSGGAGTGGRPGGGTPGSGGSGTGGRGGGDTRFSGTTINMEINVHGSTDPRTTAREVFEEARRIARTGASDPFETTRR